MSTLQLVVSILLFGTAFWLGLYLFVRTPGEWYARFGGAAQLAFAAGVALFILDQYAPSILLALRFYRFGFGMIALTSLLMLASLVALVPGFNQWQRRWVEQKSHLLLAWAGMILYVFCVGVLLWSGSDTAVRFVMMTLAGVALILIGIALVMVHAFDEAESWLPHFLRSYDYALLTAVLFGGQVVFLMIYEFGVSYSFLLLLLGMIATAVIIQVFSNPVQTAVDRIAFALFPHIRQTRTLLRAESDAAQRVDASLDLMKMDEVKFGKLTRRALSQMGDLPKLAANPLTHLPLVNARLAENGRMDSTLLRAAELKIILTESIARLKPPGDAAFGTTDDWRHYNALYFPYVLGLRPYSHRYYINGTDPASKEALDWFRVQVPERTLYNWQNAAAKLIARDLQERSRQTR